MLGLGLGLGLEVRRHQGPLHRTLCAPFEFFEILALGVLHRRDFEAEVPDDLRLFLRDLALHLKGPLPLLDQRSWLWPLCLWLPPGL